MYWYSSYQDAVGFDGEAIEIIRVDKFPRIYDIDYKCEPENIKDQIIFMSMFNDILWKSDLHLERWECQELREEILTRTLDFSGTRVGMRWYGAQGGQWDSTAKEIVQRFKETSHPVFKSISALSRGILKKKGGDTTHFNGDSTNTELLFQTIHSVISSACTEQWRFGVINSAWQRMKRDQPTYLWTTRCWQLEHHMKYNFWYLLRQWHPLGYCEIGVAECVCTECSRRNFWQSLNLTVSARQKENNRILLWITRHPCVIYEQSRDTLVVFQQDQKWWDTHLFLLTGKSMSFTGDLLIFGSGLILGGIQTNSLLHTSGSVW